jgi:hypothetical protein
MATTADLLGSLAIGIALGGTLASCDGSSVGPGLVDVLSRVDARTVMRCSELEPGGGAVAACLGAAVVTPALQVLLERARQAVESASLVGPGGAGADDATDADRAKAAAELDDALDDLSAEVARTHGGSP